MGKQCDLDAVSERPGGDDAGACVWAPDIGEAYVYEEDVWVSDIVEG